RNDLSHAEHARNEAVVLLERRKVELSNAQENSKEKSIRLAELQQEFNQLKRASSQNFTTYEEKKSEYEVEEKRLEQMITFQESLVVQMEQDRDAVFELKNKLATQEEELKNVRIFLEENKNG